jgi:oligopeptidase B
MRPFQLWRHQLGTDPAGDVLVFEEPTAASRSGPAQHPGYRLVLIGLHSTNTTEWLAIPSSDPLAEPRVVLPRREGVEYAVDHLTPAGGGTGWFIVLTNEEAQDFRVLAARTTPGQPPRRTPGAR